jgi:AraC-like DNA-binding protein
MVEDLAPFPFYRDQSSIPIGHWLHRSDFRPHDALQPYVSCYWCVTTATGYEEEYTWLLKPSACAELEFNLYTPDSSRAGQCQLMLAGPHVHERERMFATGQQVVGVRFTATGFSELFQMPARQIANSYSNASESLGVWAERLHQQLQGIKKPLDRLRLIETRLLERLPERADRCAATHSALEVISNRGGKATMGDMVEAAGYCERHLRRQFQETVGVSPKQVVRLKRFWDALIFARDHEALPLAEVARRYGYCDPAHLADDFRDLMGVSPRTAVDILHFRLAPIPEAHV